MARSRAIRSSIGGWVEKRFMNARPESGLTMKRWAVAGLASIGMAWLACSRRARAEARARGFRVRRAPEASASYSPGREIATWVSMWALGARSGVTERAV